MSISIITSFYDSHAVQENISKGNVTFQTSLVFGLTSQVWEILNAPNLFLIMKHEHSHFSELPSPS